MIVAVAVVGSIAAFGMIAVAANIAFYKVLQRSVVDRHLALDEILSTETVPHRWRRGRATSDREAAEVTARDLRRLKRLHKYVAHTALVENEDVRKETLDQLVNVQAQWRQRAKSG